MDNGSDNDSDNHNETQIRTPLKVTRHSESDIWESVRNATGNDSLVTHHFSWNTKFLSNEKKLKHINEQGE